MAFEPIRRIIPKSIQAAQIAPQLTAVRVLEVFQQVLVALWGEEKASFVTPISFNQGELKLQASAPAAAQELRMAQAQLQNEINRALQKKVVLKFKIV